MSLNAGGSSSPVRTEAKPSALAVVQTGARHKVAVESLL